MHISQQLPATQKDVFIADEFLHQLHHGFPEQTPTRVSAGNSVQPPCGYIYQGRWLPEEGNET